MYLVDTNVISELVRSTPSMNVLRWFESVQAHELYLSVATVLELRAGVEKLPFGKKRQSLDRWVTIDLRSKFGSRLLRIDPEIADLAGVLIGAQNRKGHSIQVVDAILAATASAHDLLLVSRNVRDFSRLLPHHRIIDPFNPGS